MPVNSQSDTRTKMDGVGWGSGGWGGIRTHETVSRLPVFKTGAFNRSATHPRRDQSDSDAKGGWQHASSLKCAAQPLRLPETHGALAAPMR